MKKPLRKGARSTQRSQNRLARSIPGERIERATTPQNLSFPMEDDTFLAVQTVRLLDLFPDKTLKPAHRQGLNHILVVVYNMWILLQQGVPSAQRVRSAQAYINSLQPRSFGDFSVVTTRAARVVPVAVLIFPNYYSAFLPMVQSVFRQVRELDLESAGDNDQEIATHLAEGLRSQFRARSPAGKVQSVVSADLFLNDQGQICHPYEATRLLAARLAGLGDKSQVQLERYLKAARQTAWRVPEWETPDATALAEQLLPPRS